MTTRLEIAATIMKTNGIFASSGLRSTLLAAWTLFANFACRARAPGKSITEYSVAVVSGGAVLGFDGQVHIDLDRSHTVLSPDEARRFAAEVTRIADTIDPLSDREREE